MQPFTINENGIVEKKKLDEKKEGKANLIVRKKNGLLMKLVNLETFSKFEKKNKLSKLPSVCGILLSYTINNYNNKSQ